MLVICSYETGNHIRQEARGYHKTVFLPSTRLNDDGSAELDATDILVQSGTYSYLAPDGQLISVTWIADENGYRASGDHIPTPHPIPEQIAQSLASNAQQAEAQPTEHVNEFQSAAGLFGLICLFCAHTSCAVRIVSTFVIFEAKSVRNRSYYASFNF